MRKRWQPGVKKRREPSKKSSPKSSASQGPTRTSRIGARLPRGTSANCMSITYLEAIREAQARALAEDSRVFIYGQDIGAFGGAFKATKNLAQEFPGRVIDAPISEDAMMGLAVGAAIGGMR